MAIIINEVISEKEIKQFVKFPIKLYKDCPYYVPPLISDDLSTFKRGKNPALELSDSRLFLARDNGNILGRIAAVLNKPANEKNGTRNMRFGWFDCVDNPEAAEKLFTAVEQWALEEGMESITGPHGFCDLDPQGMLIEGFDKVTTIAGLYNHPYYRELVESNGFQKEIDYLEFLSKPPYSEGIPEKILEVAEWIKKRNNFYVPDYNSVRKYKKFGKEIFDLLNDTFDEIYGTVPLTDKQVEYYIEKFISYVHKDLIKLVLDKNDSLVGFIITMPSMSGAFRKAKGRLLPFGIFHMLKAKYTYDVLDFYFAAVKKEYQGKGVDTLLVLEIVKAAMKLGFKYAESNQELETNTKVQSEWKFFKPEINRRRRIFRKTLNNR